VANKVANFGLGRAKGLSTLRARIFWWLIPMILSLFVVVSVIDLYYQHQIAEEEFVERGNEMAVNLAHSSRLAAFVEDRELLISAMQGVTANGDVAYAVIYGENWKLLANHDSQPNGLKDRTWELSEENNIRLLSSGQTFSRPVTTKQGQFVEFFAPILSRRGSGGYDPGIGPSVGGDANNARKEPKPIGAVRVGLSRDRMDAYITGALKWRVSVVLIFLLLSTLFVYAFAQRITRPIKQLTDQARAIAGGHLDQQIPIESRDEIGKLGQSFNDMALALKGNLNEKEALVGQLQKVNATLEDRIRERTVELEKINLELRESTQHKSEFLANVNHELRTPLTAIIGYTRILRRETEGQIPQLQKENLENLLHNGEHLLQMINSLLNLAKIEAGRMEVRAEPVQIEDAIEWSIATVGPMVNDRIRLTSEIAPNLPTLNSDPIILRQIVLNLLSNAAKFTDQGEIKISALQKNGSLSLAVSDTGIGIKEEELEDIFGEFRRGDTLRNQTYTGTGLGLAIVRQLVAFLGGDITVDSQVDKGSTFTMTLPWDRTEHVMA